MKKFSAFSLNFPKEAIYPRRLSPVRAHHYYPSIIFQKREKVNRDCKARKAMGEGRRKAAGFFRKNSQKAFIDRRYML